MHIPVFRQTYTKRTCCRATSPAVTDGAENEIRTRDPRLGKAVLYR
jgi:hypothetical protein